MNQLLVDQYRAWVAEVARCEHERDTAFDTLLRNLTADELVAVMSGEHVPHLQEGGSR